MNKYFWIAGAIGFLALDLFSKQLAIKYLQAPVPVWPGVFQLSLSYNTGVAFSIPIPNIIMLTAAPILLLTLIFGILKYCDSAKPIAKLICILFAAGALGNWLNRLTLGAVVDFISFSFWPSFNLADSYITIAALLLIICYGKIGVKKNTDN